MPGISQEELENFVHLFGRIAENVPPGDHIVDFSIIEAVQLLVCSGSYHLCLCNSLVPDINLD